MSDVVLTAENLARRYKVSRGAFRDPAIVNALADASFTLSRRRTLAVVGESGCGKSTLARLVAMIEPPSEGRLAIDGIDVASAGASERAALRPKVQIVFQNPYGSLNPRQRIRDALEEPLIVNGRGSGEERRQAVAEMMEAVGLRPEFGERYPHMFSGGQRQRIAIARAIAMEPDVLVADEAVSALDVSVQDQVLKLLEDLQAKLGIAILFITHDLRVAAQICDDVLVMQKGRVVEHGPAGEVLAHPEHPYTRSLIEAAPGRNWDFANFRELTLAS